MGGHGVPHLGDIFIFYCIILLIISIGLINPVGNFPKIEKKKRKEPHKFLSYIIIYFSLHLHSFTTGWTIQEDKLGSLVV